MNSFSKAGPQWSGFFLFPLVLLAFSVISCQNQAESELKPEKTVQVTNGPTRSYLGLTKAEAIKKAKEMGLRSRVVRDGFERYPMTKDLRQDRINFEIDKGLVTAAKIY